MKTQTEGSRPPKASGLRFLPAAAAMAAAAATAAPVRADSQGDPKPYTLFMGADVAVGLDSGIYPVWDVSGGSWVVKMNGQPVALSTKDHSFNLKITPGLKLTEVSASVANLKAEPSCSPGNDPYAKFTRQTSEAAADAAQSQYQTNLANAQMGYAIYLSMEHPLPGPGASASNLAAAQAAAMATATTAVAASNVNAGATPGLAVGSDTVFDTDRYDAMDVRFEVSAERPLNHPY